MFAATITQEEMNELPLGSFPGRIVVIDREGEVAAACQFLKQHTVLGFDTETRPTFKAGVVHRVALLQLSTRDVCFLFRLSHVRLERQLAAILESQKILQIGAALSGDIQVLQKLRRFRQGGFVDLQSIVNEWGIAEKSVRKMAAVVLGMRISKAQRLSNWEAATLTPAQQAYAATDAWACLEIYRRLIECEKVI